MLAVTDLNLARLGVFTLPTFIFSLLFGIPLSLNPPVGKSYFGESFHTYAYQGSKEIFYFYYIM